MGKDTLIEYLSSNDEDLFAIGLELFNDLERPYEEKTVMIERAGLHKIFFQLYRKTFTIRYGWDTENKYNNYEYYQLTDKGLLKHEGS